MNKEQVVSICAAGLAAVLLAGCGAMTELKEGATEINKQNTQRFEMAMKAYEKEGNGVLASVTMEPGARLENTGTGKINFEIKVKESLASILLALGGAKSSLADIDDYTTPSMQATVVPYLFSFGTAATLGYINYLNNREAWSVVGETTNNAITNPVRPEVVEPVVIQ